jgi:hypothetical protein
MDRVITRSATFLFSLVLSVAPLSAQTGILFADVAVPRSLDLVYEETQPIRGKCGDDSACWARALRGKEVILNPVFSGPSRGTRLLGHVVAVPAFAAGRELHFRLDLRSTSGRQTPWIADVGDWGYGVNVFVRSTRKQWIQLPGGPFASSAWIELAPFEVEGRLSGEVGSIVGTVIWISPEVSAVDRRTGRRTTLATDVHYVIERIYRGEAFLRTEVGADMSCGEPDAEKDVATSETPRFRVKLTDLFDRRGIPKLGPYYTKGC